MAKELQIMGIDFKPSDGLNRMSDWHKTAGESYGTGAKTPSLRDVFNGRMSVEGIAAYVHDAPRQRRAAAEKILGSSDSEGVEIAEAKKSLRTSAAAIMAETADEVIDRIVTYRPDPLNTDIWSPPSQTIAARRGDCEDFALAKYGVLKQAGFDENKMWLVLGHQKNGLLDSSYHAVLMVELDGKNYFLNNDGEKKLIPEKEFSKKFVPYEVFNKNGYHYADNVPAVEKLNNSFTETIHDAKQTIAGFFPPAPHP